MNSFKSSPLILTTKDSPFLKFRMISKVYKMTLSKMSMFLLVNCVMGLALLEPSHAQNTQQDYVDSHNAARKAVGVANVTWNSTVAAYAANYANSRKADCSLVHLNGPYGENLAKGSGSFSGRVAVDLWVAEKPHYVYANNSCIGGECLHYTQVVWHDSLRIGCARVQCNNGWWFVTCNYDYPGNYIGETPY